MTLAHDILQKAGDGYGKDRFGHPATSGQLCLTWAELDEYSEMIHALQDANLLQQRREFEYYLTRYGWGVLNVINNEMPITKDFTQE